MRDMFAGLAERAIASSRAGISSHGASLESLRRAAGYLANAITWAENLERERSAEAQSEFRRRVKETLGAIGTGFYEPTLKAE